MNFLFSWFQHVDKQRTQQEPEQSPNISWLNASLSSNQRNKTADVSVLLPLFQDSSKSTVMIKHTMDVIKQAVSIVNGNQTPVIAFDQPLYAIAKQIQWNWKSFQGGDRFVVTMGPLHIEMAVLKTFGNWLDESGWSSALEKAGLASAGTVQSFIFASHVSRTRQAHQITASALFTLMKQAYPGCISTSEKNVSFEPWRKEWVKNIHNFNFGLLPSRWSYWFYRLFVQYAPEISICTGWQFKNYC